MTETPKNSTAFDKYIEYEVQFSVERRQQAAEAFSASARWLSASLFALNGGAILGLLQIDGYSKEIFEEASLAYLAGIILCFGMVIIWQYGDQKAATLLYERGNRLIQQLDPKAPFAIRDVPEEGALRVISRLNKTSQLMGVLSLCAFLVGCWLASSGI